jgi:RES domain-containing protein
VTLSSWRLVKRKHRHTAFSGEGARLYGGRWNSPGVAVVYTAGSPSLAALELLVHLEAADLLRKYVFFEVRIDESSIAEINAAALPKDWKAEPPPASARSLGDTWLARGSSAVLRIPSAIVPVESNFLLNPGHADFVKLEFRGPWPFQFDPRLRRKKNP